jgi:hypothetical protein
MTNGAKFALASVAAFVIAVGGEVLYMHHQRVEDANAPVVSKQAAPTTTYSDDDRVLMSLHKERPDSLKDERNLIGKTLWVSAGDQLDYYKDAGNHVDYAKPAGTLQGADPMSIKGVFEEQAPATGRAVFRVPAGDRQVLLAFTLPKSGDPKQLYATPVGDHEDGVYQFITDGSFFYDDPHTLYHWPADAWAHIDKHECAVGMTENQCMMALGQTVQFQGDEPGNRSITFNNGGHTVRAVFEDGKATKVQQ